VHDEERQSAVDEAVVDGIEQEPRLDRGDRARRQQAAQARQRERGGGLGAGVAVGLGHHHRRRDHVGGDDARGRDERFVGDEPSGHTGAGQGDHGAVGRAETAGAEPDRKSEDRRVEDHVRAGHEQAPRSAVGALRETDDDPEHAPDQPRPLVGPGGPAERVTDVRDVAGDADQRRQDAQHRGDLRHAHDERRYGRPAAVRYVEPPQDFATERARKTFGGST
jgi:hypothetical protein